MTDSEPSKFVVALIIFCFFALGGGSSFFAIKTIFDIYQSIGDNFVLVREGMFYLLGVGVCTLVLVFDGVYSKVLNKSLSKSGYKILNGLLLVGLLTTFLAPHGIHYVIGKSLSEYSICEKQSRQWLFVRSVVYANHGNCSDYIR